MLTNALLHPCFPDEATEAPPSYPQHPPWAGHTRHLPALQPPGIPPQPGDNDSESRQARVPWVSMAGAPQLEPVPATSALSPPNTGLCETQSRLWGATGKRHKYWGGAPGLLEPLQVLLCGPMVSAPRQGQ